MSPPLKSPAERLLVALCRSTVRQETVKSQLRHGGIHTLRHLEALAVRHGVQGLVWSGLVGALSDDDEFAEFQRIAKAGLTRLQRQTTFRDLEQDRVLSALAAAGFEPLVLKGGALRRGIFMPLERVMGDLDILVEPTVVTPVLEVLQTLGYQSEYPEKARAEFRRHHNEEQVTHAMGFLVDVHWGLTRPRNSIQLDHERFRARSVTVERRGSRPVRIPCPEDLMIHTVSQIEQESLRGLRRVVDLDRIARKSDLDWDDVRHQADVVGLGGFLRVAIRMAQYLLGTSAPDDLVEGIHLSVRARAAIDALQPVRRLLDEPNSFQVIESHLFRLWCMDDAHRRAWVGETFAGRSDPLQWVWEGREMPGDADREGTTGVLFLLKLAAYQAIVETSATWRRLGDDHPGASAFWPPDRVPSITETRSPPA